MAKELLSDCIFYIEQKLKAAFLNYSIINSSEILLEIMENGMSKAAAIRTLYSLWNIYLKDAIVFGDNYNVKYRLF